MTMVYHDEDGNVDYLRGKRVGVIGYGNMGSPMALNLRDSGVDVILHEPRAERREQALEDGFSPVAIAELVAAADIIMPLLRDEAMPKIYLEGVSPHLRRGQTLIFSSAYNLTFGFIEAPPFVDVGLVAARTRRRRPRPLPVWRRLRLVRRRRAGRQPQRVADDPRGGESGGRAQSRRH
ncbi:MAG: NAD(P)-binding domain-containing protein [Chloroflexi bacterium]|nr:NAD(P)-binding domain-containing protein [Chloroflexota bacterium]